MQLPKNILVVISGKRKVHEALERALLFAELSTVKIHIFNVIYQPIGDLTNLLSSQHREEMQQQYMADRELYLKEIAAEVEKKGIKCSVELAWHAEMHEAIEAVAKKRQPDLVIKRISAKSSSINPFAMPTDRHLLRYCPAPLLLVKSASWKKGPICAAIDPMANDTSHKQLNNDALSYATMLGKVSKSPICAVSSYIVPTMTPAIGVPGVDYDLIRRDTYKSFEEKLRALVESHDIPLTDMHIVEGHAENAIPKFANDQKATLMILGTVGRTGVLGAFIGNTAERVLAELTCEVLAIKPQIKA